MKQEEQEAFVPPCSAPLSSSSPPVAEERFEDDLRYQLGLLAGVHGVALGQMPQRLRVSRITAIIGANPRNARQLPAPRTGAEGEVSVARRDVG